MGKNPPKILYKYHRINEHLFELIKEGNFWFSHQNELNDPYDCRYALSDTFLYSVLKNSSDTFITDLSNKNSIFKNVNKDEFYNKILPRLKGAEWMNIFYGMLFGKNHGWSVCCFTTDPLNEIMWTHYSDCNKGVCLGFDLTKSPTLWEKLIPVKYNDEFPEINSINDLPEALRKKRRVWRIEKEWRIISKENGKIPFNKSAFVSIYFGYKAPKSDIENIVNIINESGYVNVDFKQCCFQIKGIKLRPSKIIEPDIK